jgi:hypothetical protein
MMTIQVKGDGCALQQEVPLWEKIVMQCLRTCPSCREEHGQQKKMCANSATVLSFAFSHPRCRKMTLSKMPEEH